MPNLSGPNLFLQYLLLSLSNPVNVSLYLVQICEFLRLKFNSKSPLAILFARIFGIFQTEPLSKGNLSYLSIVFRNLEDFLVLEGKRPGEGDIPFKNREKIAEDSKEEGNSSVLEGNQFIERDIQGGFCRVEEAERVLERVFGEEEGLREEIMGNFEEMMSKWREEKKEYIFL
jgi:hypothetical protein